MELIWTSLKHFSATCILLLLALIGFGLLIGAEAHLFEDPLAYQLDTLAGATITPDVASRRLKDNESLLRAPRIFLNSRRAARASNGVISTINRVLIPIDTSPGGGIHQETPLGR